MEKEYIFITENGIRIDLTNGINPYIGTKGAIVTRNNHKFRLLYGIPGTGKYTHSTAVRGDSHILIIIAVMFIAAFAVLTSMIAHADYSITNLFHSFFSFGNIVRLLLFILILIAAFYAVMKYKRTIYRRYVRYSEKLSEECKAVEKAMESADGIKFEILSHYRECLFKEMEMTEPKAVIATLKESFNSAKYQDEIKFYRDKINTLEGEILKRRFQADMADEKTMSKFRSLCECFEILYTGARFWDISTYENPFRGHPWISAYFASGVFDYILSQSYTPTIYTASGQTLVIYPQFVILANSTTDFEVYPLDSIHMESGRVPGHSSYGYLRIPKLNLAFTTSDPYDLEIFVNSFEAYKNGTYDPDSIRQVDSMIEEVALYCILSRKVTRNEIKCHFNIGQGRTERILRHLAALGIVSEENSDGIRDLLIWDVEKVEELISRSRN